MVSTWCESYPTAVFSPAFYTDPHHLSECLQAWEGGTQYKRPYKDVPPTWVAKSASWSLNDLLFYAKFGKWMGKFFNYFLKLKPNLAQI